MEIFEVVITDEHNPYNPNRNYVRPFTSRDLAYDYAELLQDKYHVSAKVESKEQALWDKMPDPVDAKNMYFIFNYVPDDIPNPWDQAQTTVYHQIAPDTTTFIVKSKRCSIEELKKMLDEHNTDVLYLGYDSTTVYQNFAGRIPFKVIDSTEPMKYRNKLFTAVWYLVKDHPEFEKMKQIREERKKERIW